MSNIPIVHVHGILGRYPEVEYKQTIDPMHLYDISCNIQVIHELKDRPNEFCNSDFQNANRLLRQASRVIFLGFGYHGDNIRRLGFFKAEDMESIELYGTTLGYTDFLLTKTFKDLASQGFDLSKIPYENLSCDNIFQVKVSLD